MGYHLERPMMHDMKKKLFIILYIIISFIIVSLVIWHVVYIQNQFNKKNAVFEFYAQDLHIPNDDGNGYHIEGTKNRVSYYLGIDKYRNLYVIGGNESESLVNLWNVPLKSKGKMIEYKDSLYGINNSYVEASEEEQNEKTKKIEAMKLDEYILSPIYIFQKKLSKEEYEEIISLMKDVENTWIKDNASQFIYIGPEESYLHFYRFNNKCYTFGSLVEDQKYVGIDLGACYEYWGEIATNNIIKVRGILDKYIDSSLDPEQFNYSKWKNNYYIHMRKGFSKEYTIPSELYE